MTEPYRGKRIRHVALEAGEENVIFPRAEPGLVQRVLTLTVQRQEHILTVHLIVVKSRTAEPRDRAALARSQALDGMEREGREVGKIATHHTAAARAEPVCGVRDHDNAVKKTLYGIARVIKRLFRFKSGINTVIIAKLAAEIDRDYHLRALGDRIGNCVVVHFKAVGSAVYHDDARTDVSRHRRSCGVCVGRNYDLVAFADAEETKSELGCGSLRVEADDALGAEVFGKAALKQLGARAGGYPAGTQGCNDLVYLGLRDVGGRKRNTSVLIIHDFP